MLIDISSSKSSITFPKNLQSAPNRVLAMKQHIFQSKLQVASESLRYSTDLPGQAMSYKIGHKVFGDIRSQVEDELAGHFDIRAFHQIVMGSGSMDLNTLKKHIHWYIGKAEASRCNFKERKYMKE